MDRSKFTFLVSCLLFGFLNSVQAQSWVPELETPSNTDYYRPMETIGIYIPIDVPESVLQSLVLEMDNIDVTAMVVLNGEYAEFTPVQPLTWGKHVLRLVEYAENGDIAEKGYWEIQVRRTSVFREAEYAADINLIASQRIAEKNLVAEGEDEPDAFSAQGTAVLEGRVADDHWQVHGQMDLIYNSADEQTINDRNLDMGEYLVTGEFQSANTRLNLGHHSLAQTSLIMQGFNRRGLSGSVGLASLNSTVSGFVMRAQEISGFNYGLGISDSDNRVSGIVWETQPLTESPQLLYISATYLLGEKTSSGENIGEDDFSQQGDAVALVVDSSVMDQQVRLRAEAATSTNDVITADTTDTDLEGEKDNAYSFLVSYSPQPRQGNESFIWNTGYEYNKINTYFSSLANPGLPADKKLNRLFFNVDWGELSAQLSTANEKDNVNDIEELPQIETSVNQLSVNYNLTEVPPPGSILDIFGTPTFGLQFSETNQKQIKNVFNSTGDTLYTDLNIDYETILLSASFTRDHLNWALSYSISEQDNKIAAENNQQTTAYGMDMNWQLNQNVAIAPSIQLQTTELDFDNSSTDTQILGLTTQWNMPNRLNGSVLLNRTETQSDSISLQQDMAVNSLSFQLSWAWTTATNNKPGFDVSLSGVYQDLQDRVTDVNSIDSYQIFVNLVMKLPISSLE